MLWRGSWWFGSYCRPWIEPEVRCSEKEKPCGDLDVFVLKRNTLQIIAGRSPFDRPTWRLADYTMMQGIVEGDCKIETISFGSAKPRVRKDTWEIHYEELLTPLDEICVCAQKEG